MKFSMVHGSAQCFVSYTSTLSDLAVADAEFVKEGFQSSEKFCQRPRPLSVSGNLFLL